MNLCYIKTQLNSIELIVGIFFRQPESPEMNEKQWEETMIILYYKFGYMTCDHP